VHESSCYSTKRGAWIVSILGRLQSVNRWFPPPANGQSRSAQRVTVPPWSVGQRLLVDCLKQLVCCMSINARIPLPNRHADKTYINSPTVRDHSPPGSQHPRRSTFNLLNTGPPIDALVRPNNCTVISRCSRTRSITDCYYAHRHSDPVVSCPTVICQSGNQL